MVDSDLPVVDNYEDIYNYANRTEERKQKLADGLDASVLSNLRDTPGYEHLKREK